MSAFEHGEAEAAGPVYTGHRRAPALASAVRAELLLLERERSCGDALEVMAVLRRQREAALVHLACERLVWPVTVFPTEMIFHSPHDLGRVPAAAMRSLRALSVESPGVLPAGAWADEPADVLASYRPLAPLLWRMALHGPRSRLLAALRGAAAYRLLHATTEDGCTAPNAMRAGLDRVARRSTSLAELAGVHGMNIERAARLLNALYLVSNLMVTRASPAARREPLLAFLRWPSV